MKKERAKVEGEEKSSKQNSIHLFLPALGFLFSVIAAYCSVITERPLRDGQQWLHCTVERLIGSQSWQGHPTRKTQYVIPHPTRHQRFKSTIRLLHDTRPESSLFFCHHKDSRKTNSDLPSSVRSTVGFGLDLKPYCTVAIRSAVVTPREVVHGLTVMKILAVEL